MIDIGTIPTCDSIAKLALYMNDPGNKEVGGVAGEIEVFKPQVQSKCCTFESMEASTLFYTQYIEYKLSHFIDKAFEACFGFISVLPGAFCMFRWEAIKGDPLKSFFHGLDKQSHTPTEANMFLAEDRIMCLEILVKAGC